MEPTTTLTLTESEVKVLHALLGDMPNKSGTFELYAKIVGQHNEQDKQRERDAILAEIETETNAEEAE